MPLDYSHTEFFAIVSVISLAVFAVTFQSSFALLPANFQTSLTDETTKECRIRVSTDQSLSPIKRYSAMKQCDLFGDNDTPKKINLEKYGPKLKKAYEKAHDILAYCDQNYPIFLRTDEIQFYTLVKLPLICIKAYNSPYWNLTGIDRTVKIADYVRNQTLQELENTKDQRLLSVEEARIRQGQIMFLEDVFIQIENKIKNLILQIEEKNEQITKNESIIQEQQKTIDDLSKKIKTTILTSTEIEKLAKKTLEECLEIVATKPLTFMEKYFELQECTSVNRHKQIVIDDEIITKYSEKILDFCVENYDVFSSLSIYDYHDAIKHPFTRACPYLYENPIWEVEGVDRRQVLLDFIFTKLKELIEEKGGERLKSVYEAHIRQGFLQVLPDVYNNVKRKITSLELQIVEQNEQIEKQKATIQKQLKEIVILTEKIKNTVLEQNSNLIIKF